MFIFVESSSTGVVSTKNHFARNIVDPPCWRQYEGDMLSIRNLDGAPDRGAQDPFHGPARRFDG